MSDISDLVLRIIKAETPRDGEVILIEWLSKNHPTDQVKKVL